MQYTTDLVSVIIPTYNRYDALLRAVDSVLAQTHPSIQIIVVDDGSTDPRYKTTLHDDLQGACRAGGRAGVLRIVSLPENLRKKYRTPVVPCQGLTRNEGLKVAEGEWVAFLDDDDIWIDKDKLAKQIAVMRTHGVYFSATNMVTEHGPADTRDTRLITRAVLQTENPLPCSTVVIRHSYMDRVGGFRHVYDEDYDCWKRVSEFSDCMYINIVTVLYDSKSVKYYKVGI